MFGSKKKTYVSSTLYNLSGDPAGKPTFKRTAVAGAIVRNADMAQDLRNSYLTGYGISTRSFGRWGVTSGYNDEIGLLESELALQSSFDRTKVQDYLQQGALGHIEVLQAGAGPGDISLWADQYIIDQFLLADADNWKTAVEYDYEADASLTSLLVRIGPTPATGEADTRPVYVTPLTNFDRTANYVYAIYRSNTEGDVTRTVLGNWRTINGTTVKEPDLTGWTLHSGTQNVSTPVSLRTTVSTRTVATDGQTASTGPTQATHTEYASVSSDEWRRDVYVGSTQTNSLDLETEHQAIQRDYSYVIKQSTSVVLTSTTLNGVPATRTTTTVTETLVAQKRYRQNVEASTTRRYGPIKMMIYKIGSGVAELDALFVLTKADVDWLPFIPVRLDNRFIEEYDTDLFALTKRAYRKAFGLRSKISDLIDALKDNKSLHEIDFAHVAFGVPMNTNSAWGKQYIYTYLKQLAVAANLNKATYDDYNAQYTAYLAYVREMRAWNAAQETSAGIGKPQPTPVAMPVTPRNYISYRSSRTDLHFHQRIEFDFLYEETGTGRRTVSNKPVAIGSLWWETMEESTAPAVLTDLRNSEGGIQQAIAAKLSKYKGTHALYWQVSSREWKRMVMRNGMHANYPYYAHGIRIYAADALADKDESGFFFPMNLAIFKSMGLTDSTEMYNCSAYIILNSYQVVKKKWYQTGLFAIIVIVVAIIYSVVTAGQSLTTAGGILGTNVAVGTAIVGGSSLLVAAIVGAIANAIAATVLGAILTRAATKLFGNTILGQIIATIAVIMISGWRAGVASGNAPTFAESFGALTRAENLMRLGMSAVTGLRDYIAKGTMSILQEADELREAYSAESRRIQEMYVDQFGAGKVIDPMAFTQSGQGGVESADTFLSRTLMTGMDVATTTHNMLNEFASLTLNLEMKV